MAPYFHPSFTLSSKGASTVVIQWFPGHMAKAKREVETQLKRVDVVLELRDARIPYSSANPMLDRLIGEKPRLILLNKADLADPSILAEWQAWYHAQGIETILLDVKQGKGLQQIERQAFQLVSVRLEKQRAKGMNPRPVRAMILGIPNVGKSSLINRWSKRNIAKTGDRPAVTKGQQWVKVSPQLELLDTPGILWPKFEDQKAGYRLAICASIKDEILNVLEVASFAIAYMRNHYTDRLEQRYGITSWEEEPWRAIEQIGKVRGCMMSGGRVDLEKAAQIFLRDLRQGQLGPCCFERPEDVQEVEE